jgi:hypothetical protein
MTRGLALVLTAALLITCGPAATVANPTSTSRNTGSPSQTPSNPVPTPNPLTLHAVSWSRATTPHEQIVFEGGNADEFSELRLVGPEGTPIASGTPVPRALEISLLCPAGKSGQPPPIYGELRVTVSLASQEQLGDVISHPERYQVEILAHGTWQAVPFKFECHAQE